MIQQQILLDITPSPQPTLASFIATQHTEAIHLLHRFLKRQPGAFQERSVYLWGEHGAGKSHLLKALAQSPSARYIDANTPDQLIRFDEHITLYLIDNCDQLSQDDQHHVFDLFNQTKEHHAFFVAAGLMPPNQLPLREDVRTRLGWGLIYHIKTLCDEDKMAAIQLAAKERGMTIPANLLPYLIKHYERDMTSLTHLVESLIQYALEQKRLITLPLLREFMQQRYPTDADLHAL